MAKVKFGAQVVDMRGKLGGHVYSKNRGGAYVRTKVTPTNPQTADQVEQRARLASFSQAWRSLSEIARLGWNSVVSQWAKTDVFGDIVNPTGANLHTRLNINIALVGGSAISVPPAPQGIISPAGLTVSADATENEIILGFTNTPIPAGIAMVVEATPQLSAGISNANNQFRIISVLPAGTATGADLYVAYAEKFGALVEGQKMQIRVKFVSISTGEVSQSLVQTTIVTA